jgi:hypothetical protein
MLMDGSKSDREGGRLMGASTFVESSLNEKARTWAMLIALVRIRTRSVAKRAHQSPIEGINTVEEPSF